MINEQKKQEVQIIKKVQTKQLSLSKIDEIDMTVITYKVLKKLDACEDGLEWWIKNIGESFLVADLSKIEDDYEGYVEWLKDKFDNYTYDKYGNAILHSNSDGYSWDKTYDNQDNPLSHVDNDGD